MRDQSLEAQPQWRNYAHFMNGLEAEGMVILGGPLEGTPDFLLIMQGEEAETFGSVSMTIPGHA